MCSLAPRSQRNSSVQAGPTSVTPNGSVGVGFPVSSNTRARCLTSSANGRRQIYQYFARLRMSSSWKDVDLKRMATRYCASIRQQGASWRHPLPYLPLIFQFSLLHERRGNSLPLGLESAARSGYRRRALGTETAHMSIRLTKLVNLHRRSLVRGVLSGYGNLVCNSVELGRSTSREMKTGGYARSLETLWRLHIGQSKQ